MQKKLDEVCELVRALEENFENELDEISKLMRMRLKAELGQGSFTLQAD